MPRPPKKDRSQVAAETLTIRLTREESGWLAILVERKGKELAEEGARVSKASLVRGLIRREARSAKLPTSRRTATM